MVKEPLGFVKVLQWVSVVWAMGREREAGSGIWKSRGAVGVESNKWMVGLRVEGHSGIVLQGKVPGAWGQRMDGL